MQSRRIWNPFRRWMGNIIPLGMGTLVALLLPSTLAGFTEKGIVFVATSYVGIGLFGFFQNKKISSELRSITNKLESGEVVGFVYDQKPDYLDAHAEIGILEMNQELLVLTTEDRTIQLPLKSLKGVKFGINIHALIGLGGWIVLEFKHPLKLESRKYSTMFKSAKRTRQLRRELINILNKS